MNIKIKKSIFICNSVLSIWRKLKTQVSAVSVQSVYWRTPRAAAVWKKFIYLAQSDLVPSRLYARTHARAHSQWPDLLKYAVTSKHKHDLKYRVRTLADNCRLFLTAATPPCLWEVGWLGYVNAINEPTGSETDNCHIKWWPCGTLVLTHNVAW
jgi:hypothetical protein